MSAGPLVPARLSAHARSAGRDDNPRYVEAWHFRNRANTDPNEGDVNAPQHEREFAFVVTPEAYRAAATALDALLWGQHSHVERAQARAALHTAQPRPRRATHHRLDPRGGRHCGMVTLRPRDAEPASGRRGLVHAEHTDARLVLR